MMNNVADVVVIQPYAIVPKYVKNAFQNKNIKENIMLNIYIRPDYTIAEMYRVMVYSEFQGYWSTSELLNKEQAQEKVRFYRGLRK